MIHLEIITPENWRLGLTVQDDQRRFVSDSAGILARAYAYRENRSQAFVIYNNDLPIGMAMYYDIDDWKAYNFSQFFIDQRYQGNGLGYEAAIQIIQMMKEDGKYDKVVLCYVEGDNAAQKLYEKIGFKHTGEADAWMGEIAEDAIVREEVKLWHGNVRNAAESSADKTRTITV